VTGTWEGLGDSGMFRLVSGEYTPPTPSREPQLGLFLFSCRFIHLYHYAVREHYRSLPSDRGSISYEMANAQEARTTSDLHIIPSAGLRVVALTLGHRNFTYMLRSIGLESAGTLF